MRTLSSRPLWLCVPALIALFADIGLASAAGSTTPYQESRFCKASSNGCSMDFEPVPAGERLEISNATCYFALAPSSARAVLAELAVYDRRKNISSQFLTPVFAGSSSTTATSAATDQVFTFATAGQKAIIVVAGTDDATQLQAACSISGHMVAAT